MEQFDELTASHAGGMVVLQKDFLAKFVTLW